MKTNRQTALCLSGPRVTAAFVAALSGNATADNHVDVNIQCMSVYVIIEVYCIIHTCTLCIDCILLGSDLSIGRVQLQCATTDGR